MSPQPVRQHAFTHSFRSLRIGVPELALIAGLALCASVLRAADTLPEPEQIRLGAGKTHLIDTPTNIRRVAVAAPVATAVPVGPRSIMLNGMTPGETSMVIWLDDGTRREYDVNVTLPESRLETARKQLETEFGGKITMSVDNGTVYLGGTAKDLFSSQRAVAIAETLGRVVNLLNIEIPPQETQILLKVRFADVDRSKSQDLGINFVGAPKGFPFSVKTGAQGSAGSVATTNGGGPATITLSDALNLLFFDPQINVGATLKDLEGKAVLQILAEPNVLALNGRPASFVSGGEFPVPVVQGGSANGTAVSITFRQFGVQIRFLPTITPRGTIRLHLTPEVSSLDYANALTLSGFTVPALTSRKVDTDVELKDGQSFAIAGLLDQRTTDSLSKIPGLANIPLFGKLFQARTTSKSNSELLIIITAELVAPIPNPGLVPDLERPVSFLDGPGVMHTPPQTPGPEKTGPPSIKPTRDQLPVQELEKFQRDLLNQGGAGQPAVAPYGAAGAAFDSGSGLGTTPPGAPAGSPTGAPAGATVSPGVKTTP